MVYLHYGLYKAEASHPFMGSFQVELSQESSLKLHILWAGDCHFCLIVGSQLVTRMLNENQQKQITQTVMRSRAHM